MSVGLKGLEQVALAHELRDKHGAAGLPKGSQVIDDVVVPAALQDADLLPEAGQVHVIVQHLDGHFSNAIQSPLVHLQVSTT